MSIMKQRDLADRLFWMADEDEIKSARTTDIYFLNTKEVLAKNNIDSEVVMEVFARDLPYPGIWGVLTGVYEVVKLLEGLPVDVWSFDEGSIFLADAKTTFYEPVMTITGACWCRLRSWRRTKPAKSWFARKTSPIPNEPNLPWNRPWPRRPSCSRRFTIG